MLVSFPLVYEQWNIAKFNLKIKILARGEMTTIKKERKEKKAPTNTTVLFFLGGFICRDSERNSSLVEVEKLADGI